MIFVKIVQRFGQAKHSVFIENPELTQHSLDLQQKLFRKMFLDRPLLEKRKIIVPIKRERLVEDTLQRLHQKKEAPAVILKRDEWDDLDIVLDQKQMYSIKNFRDSKTQSFYFQKHDGELIRTTQHSIFEHPVHRFIVWSKFNRYIVGRPNLISLPILIEDNNKNQYINVGNKDFIQKINHVQVYSYNHDYPSRIVIDPAFVSSSRPYKIGDLQQLLPDGIELHPDHKRRLQNIVFQIRIETPPALKLTKEEQELQALINDDDDEETIDRKLEEKETLDSIREAEGEEGIVRYHIEQEERRKRKEAKKAQYLANKKARSLKEKIANLGLKVKENDPLITDTNKKKK